MLLPPPMPPQFQLQQPPTILRPPSPKPVPKPVPEVVTSLVEDQYGYAVQKEVKLAEVPEKTDGRKSGKSDSNEDGSVATLSPCRGQDLK